MLSRLNMRRSPSVRNRASCWGVYAVLFFLMAQLLNRVRLGQSPTTPIYAGGALIVAGGLLMAFWRV